jgi:excisionase family DNA binding protein
MPEQSEHSEREFTIQEAATELGFTVRTIHKYIASGKLPSLKKNNRVLIPAEAVEGMKRSSCPVHHDHERQVIVDRNEYEALLHRHEGLLIKMGQLEAEVRFTRQENQKLLEDLRTREEKKAALEPAAEEVAVLFEKIRSLGEEVDRLRLPWWRRWWGGRR